MFCLDFFNVLSQFFSTFYLNFFLMFCLNGFFQSFISIFFPMFCLSFLFNVLFQCFFSVLSQFFQCFVSMFFVSVFRFNVLSQFFSTFCLNGFFQCFVSIFFVSMGVSLANFGRRLFLQRVVGHWKRNEQSPRNVWPTLSGRIFGISHAGPGTGLDDPGGSLPAQDLLGSCDDKWNYAEEGTCGRAQTPELRSTQTCLGEAPFGR